MNPGSVLVLSFYDVHDIQCPGDWLIWEGFRLQLWYVRACALHLWAAWGCLGAVISVSVQVVCMSRGGSGIVLGRGWNCVAFVCSRCDGASLICDAGGFLEFSFPGT